MQMSDSTTAAVALEPRKAMKVTWSNLMAFCSNLKSEPRYLGCYGALRLCGGLSLSGVKLPFSQQATKHSVTDFNSSHRARMLFASLLVIWLSEAAVAMTASKSANSCTI